ncbi:tripartite ATP-independent transporter DctM subunit [Nonlabens dokdonensis]|uniref:TRAP-type C4-dicarboxylate transport system, large permease component n=2 Tax=Nonlabens dokdonensis TaxID=328515 RepID=L7W5K7_NONDD|nr:TRAP transporter large permease [Nonlabens dokdonensis]AGC75472.1 TRAP-type C4-dicarboxylate transport system, large permease component [Nonlabens dokdonensis DSW-6]PZX43168.1 tripartite ATP-independent transporter DctM subunit [Nonlabens dokdonensis]
MNYIEILILVLSFLVFLSLRVPIAYAIGLAGFITLVYSMPFLPSVTTMAQRMATSLDSFTLSAIPFFILAGQIMNRGGIAVRLINFAKAIVGPLPGGLAFVNIISCMLFGAISGSAVAAASAIGGFMNPMMEKDGYSKPFSAAVNITSATTGLIIPPSNVLIVYSLASGGVSIAALFIAGYVPGLLLGLALMIVAAIYSIIKKYPTDKLVSVKVFFKRFLDALPSLMLLVVVIGGIVGGIFTATEASGVAVLYTLVLGFAYKEIKFKDLSPILLETIKTSSIVLLLIATSIAMSWVMSYENIPQEISDALLGISDNPIVILILINLILLFVGIFMDMTPAVLIFTPIFLPIVTAMGMDPVHFGVIMIMNLCIGLCTPPVGSVLFVGCSVADLKIQKVIRPMLPLFLAMIAVLVLVTYFEDITLWLPRVFDLMD